MKYTLLTALRLAPLAALYAAGADGLLSQPEAIPGEWQIATDSLPPIQDIIGRRADKFPVYGLYVWANEHVKFREEVRAVGWKSLRIGGPMTDPAMKAVAEEGLEVMKTLQIGNVAGEAHKTRPDFDSDEKFLAAAQASALSFLDRYGPGGTFFRNYPRVPNRPIRLLEIWNEPNFKYMIPDREPRKQVVTYAPGTLCQTASHGAITFFCWNVFLPFVFLSDCLQTASFCRPSRSV